jgi:lipid II:glycine glycyltransferase (peptidoglycan interpeptide bridge formation enzyme)
MYKEITNQELDNFLSQQKYSQFLQSSSWNEFQKSLGYKVWQIGVFEEEELKAVVSVKERKMPLSTSYLYAGRGPVISDVIDSKEKGHYTALVLKAIRDLIISTENTNELFFRFDPLFISKDIKKIKKIKSVQPSQTLLLDLTLKQDKLLAEMHQKTRYNIRLAERKGVIVERVENPEEAIEYFWSLMSATAQRDHFNSHSRDYYYQILKNKAAGACLWVAKHEGEILAANIVMSFGDTVTYTHGASSNQKRNLMAPHLLQWEQIKWAQANKYKLYDFWGIAADDDPQNPWAGFTRFKKGFGGIVKELPGSFDLVYKPKYYKIYKMYQRIKKR